jgi:hypothetical protein
MTNLTEGPSTKDSMMRRRRMKPNKEEKVKR